MSREGLPAIFTPPESATQKIWRYLDFTKLVSLLHRRALYFPRSDLLGDPFEGSYPRANLASNVSLPKEMIDSIGDTAVQNIVKSWERSRRLVRLWTYLNSWHMNDHEPAAMWKIYAATPEAVAIQSSYETLSEVLPSSVTGIGTVAYLDFEADSIPIQNLIYPFMYKRLSYLFEHELRALIFEALGENGQLIQDPDHAPTGMHIEVDIDTLIHQIYVAPGASRWFRDVVEDICRKYELKKDVVQSSIDDEPVF